jgi:anti-sigma factor RsiW
VGGVFGAVHFRFRCARVIKTVIFPISMAGGIAQIAQEIRRRMDEIDRELEGVEALSAERDQLRRALDQLESARATAARPARRRAPRGTNRQRILAHLREAGPSAASEIASATGINRGVTYNTLKKMVADDEVAQTHDDGRAMFAVKPPSRRRR